MRTDILIALALAILVVILPTVSANNSTGITINATTWTTSGTSGSGSTSSSSSSSSGSSGGGWGAVSDEPFSNIAQSYRIEQNWKFNSSIVYPMKYDVYEVIIRTIQSEREVPLVLNILKNKSNKTTVAPIGNVYRYFNLYLGTRSVFSDITIKFRVNVTWNEGNVVLMKWNGNEWIALSTSELSRDSTFKYYQADTNSLSNYNFAIIGKPEVHQPAPAPPLIGTPIPVSGTPNASVTTEVPSEPVELSPWIIFIVILAFVGLVILYFITA